MDVSLSLILRTLSSLADIGLQVKEIEASPWAFGLLMRYFESISRAQEDVPWLHGECEVLTINHCGQAVRITMKPTLKLTLDLPPKVPLPGE